MHWCKSFSSRSDNFSYSQRYSDFPWNNTVLADSTFYFCSMNDGVCPIKRIANVISLFLFFISLDIQARSVTFLPVQIGFWLVIFFFLGLLHVWFVHLELHSIENYFLALQQTFIFLKYDFTFIVTLWACNSILLSLINFHYSSWTLFLQT